MPLIIILFLLLPYENLHSMDEYFLTLRNDKVKLAEELFNMPPSSKLLLKILEYEGSMSQKELVKKTMLPDRTVRLAMSHLLEKGYVKKKISVRDSRQKIYEISKLINSDLQQ